MDIKYVGTETTNIFADPAGKDRIFPLIFGDEVEADTGSGGKLVKAKYRGRECYIANKDLMAQRLLEIYFIDVGQGDSTFIVTPGNKKILIDGGIDHRAYGFLAWKYNLDNEKKVLDIDLLVLSHADGDHINGLIPIIESKKINVKKIIHSGIATLGKGYDTDLGNKDPDGKFLITRHDAPADLDGLNLSKTFKQWKDAIQQEGVEYHAVDSKTPITSQQIDIGDPAISIHVLGPLLNRYNGAPAYRWLKNDSKTINGHSVVLKLVYRDVAALFCGDINGASSELLMNDATIKSKLNAHIYKAPHHGSDDFYRPFLNQVNPQISIISSGDNRDYGHPRANAIGAMGQASRSAEPLIFATEIAATFIEEDTKTPAKSKKTAQPEERREDIDISSLKKAHVTFRKTLNGMINVRTDGKKLFAARRVTKPIWWEAYEPRPAV